MLYYYIKLYNMECLICFCDVSNNDYLLLDCCDKIVHINCFKTWINKNKNTHGEINKCIFCKQENDIINNLLYNQYNNNSSVNNNQELLITIPQQTYRTRLAHFKMTFINFFVCFTIIFIGIIFFTISSQGKQSKNNHTRLLLENEFISFNT